MDTVDCIEAAIAVVIFDEEGRVLLQKRADTEQWGIPSGHIEIGETIENAVIREVKEETNLDVRVTKLIGVYSDPESQVFSYPEGKTVHFITTSFLAEVIGGQLKINDDESADLKFFPQNHLPSNMINLHPCWLDDALSVKERAYIR
ncbi:ADP-ribose pyrophosphatase YjhB (NUDIX family) [Cytobacillus horneckiae]|uniref:NUDIX domain-containing protein n=1 Tax=Cytobacillus horneckiae TaxID=549687 RepID=A0A2N0ZES6_9BACI|nr:NUDIX domain-containing protein [Cytobacillus horneckiae]MBN6889447.1 NUDIX domain-containing protein [Cytobacillus horneckiae]MCM3176867.1 NUDIX domain-containing protein [Cytobacillus horneckiae]MEC1156711.1 NUDIX domain-containing protein [Cytobacillus horneckiae]MED2939068.1 NUDIX domain-containing protein [Cytobacillus horneckiae]PKG28016.1 NUDIX domain-containing protein [Cytobacillus horneckiae]